jgi:hypothetical protein
MAVPADGPHRQPFADHLIGGLIALVVGLMIALITQNAHTAPNSGSQQSVSQPTFSQIQPAPSLPTHSPVRKVVEVPANVALSEESGGFDTQITLQRNQQVSLQASGSIFYGYDVDVCLGTAQTDPDGHRTLDGRDCGTKFDPQVPAPSSPVGSLLWRVGDSAWQEVGASRIVVAPIDGDLYLGVNDDTIEDNQGWFIVSIAS